MDTYHEPVLVEEVIDGLHITAGKKYIDATIGGGGHGIEIVKRGGILLGIDVDPEALEFTKQKFEVGSDPTSLKLRGARKLENTESWKVVQGNFADIERIAKGNGFERVDGILFDLGVSSHQLDTPTRGFSYRFSDAPLDLRMDQSRGETAALLVNRLSEEELSEIFARFGEEDHAYNIAHAVCRARSLAKFQTVGQLVSVVSFVISDKKRRSAVLSRIFQALRIAVNDERSSLTAGLKGAQALLVSGGRLAVISFHSLEDRLVKQFLQQHGWRELTKRPIIASQDELRRNPRSRSAKLRIAEKL